MARDQGVIFWGFVCLFFLCWGTLNVCWQFVIGVWFVDIFVWMSVCLLVFVSVCLYIHLFVFKAVLAHSQCLLAASDRGVRGILLVLTSPCTLSRWAHICNTFIYVFFLHFFQAKKASAKGTTNPPQGLIRSQGVFSTQQQQGGVLNLWWWDSCEGVRHRRSKQRLTNSPVLSIHPDTYHTTLISSSPSFPVSTLLHL